MITAISFVLSLMSLKRKTASIRVTIIQYVEASEMGSSLDLSSKKD